MPRKRIRTGENYFKVFPTQLRNIVEEKGYTQETIGQALGKTRQAVAAYMSGTSSPDWETLAELSKLLNVSSDWLLGLRNETPLDEKMNAACEITGLTEKTIKIISEFVQESKGRTEILELLFTEPDFMYFLFELTTYINALLALHINNELYYQLWAKENNGIEFEETSSDDVKRISFAIDKIYKAERKKLCDDTDIPVDVRQRLSFQHLLDEMAERSTRNRLQIKGYIPDLSQADIARGDVSMGFHRVIDKITYNVSMMVGNLPYFEKVIKRDNDK